MAHAASIMIAAHNRSGLTLRTLESLAALDIPAGMDVECIVVANACTDDTEQVVPPRCAAMPFPTRMVVESQPGVGFARNRAVAEARHDWMLFVDSDVRADRGLLKAHLDVYREQGADLVTGRIDLWWEEIAEQDWLTPGMRLVLGEHHHGDKVVRLEKPDAFAANLSFTRSVYKTAGPFRTDIGRVGTKRMAGEETVFAQRAIDAGLKFYFTPHGFVEHWVPRSSIESDFFERSMNAGAMSIILTSRNFGLNGYLRQTTMGTVRLAAGAAGVIGSAMVGSADLARRARVMRATGLGQLQGLAARLCRGPSI